MKQTIETLKVLLQFAMSIDADMTWMTHLDKPAQVLIEAAWMNTDE